MGIHSATSSALSGLAVATAIVDSVARNLTNAQPSHEATQQVELNPPSTDGIQIARVTAERTQGPLQPNAPLPLLTLEGDGLFILERRGERLYSRDGKLALDADGYLVNSLGDRLLGYAINADGILDRTKLSPLRIQIGSAVDTPDGTTARLIGYSVQRSGRLVGKYSDGVERTLGQLRIARFPPTGPSARPNGHLYGGRQSTVPLVTDGATHGAGSIVASATDLSNVNADEQLIRLSLARSHFRLNLATLETTGSLLHELMHLSQRRF